MIAGSDLHFCKHIYEESFDSTVESTWNEIIDKLRKNDFFLLYLKISGVIVGCSIICPSQNFYFIEYLCISSKHRGCGYGKILFEKSIQFCKPFTSIIMLDCDRPLLKFYYKLNCSMHSVVYHSGRKFYRLLKIV